MAKSTEGTNNLSTLFGTSPGRHGDSPFASSRSGALIAEEPPMSVIAKPMGPAANPSERAFFRISVEDSGHGISKVSAVFVACSFILVVM